MFQKYLLDIWSLAIKIYRPLRPTLNTESVILRRKPVSGLKTVLPKVAVAKLSSRVWKTFRKPLMQDDQ
ncbi:hypothetical protein MCOR02_001010 [Pyricularia oryzae]|uniref:Uncharacterized protein n=2 Tax=Pyricularia oryzae TaxID=318829 RepID=G4NKL8_PYRO7|nr:uncharacterized protein MGG_18048 [Pyricularia oryzae 70-15]KAH9437354.1 hypothetical protein MCOR02_001010 [Pyricularia oryzae]EHA46607.1 hypothetical protein MGG_18048 [Pyricularia oryzae 70-15]KAI7915957.1 hypothetical protein M0657_008823 [Pyricularia oryzae]KAI7918416.1 hypothetical protein M9X92_006894 [Pyricularia oryzae]QBZ66395.1 hypothetical protein PoMZ_13371 [Pyricularia oryzae]